MKHRPRSSGKAPNEAAEWMRQYLIERYPHLRPKRIHWDTIVLIAGMLFVIGLLIYIGTVGL